jgi:hypothetical protein
MGYGVFAIVLGGVFAVAELIARFRPDWTDSGLAPDRDAPTRAEKPTLLAENPRQLWTCVSFVLAGSFIATPFLSHVASSPSRGGAGVVLRADGLSPVELPAFIGTEWIGRREEVTEVERQILPPDTGFSRKTYVSLSDPSKRVFLSIVLSGRDRTSIHRPELCLVGQGWTIRDSFLHRFNFGSSGDFPARVLRVEKEIATPAGQVRIPQLVAYYFVGGDVVVSDHWERLARDAWNRVVHGRSDRWAYVLLQTGDSDGDAAALGRFQEILDATLPSFQLKR